MSLDQVHVALVNLDQPGRYLHWSIFTVSLANLLVVAAMVAIFGLALLLPFPHRRRLAAEPPQVSSDSAIQETLAPMPEAGAARSSGGMWTARVRRTATALLPPDKLLPDRQPAYVASWVYVFGVATLASLGVAVVSGLAVAVGGVDWWHTTPLGQFLTAYISGA